MKKLLGWIVKGLLVLFVVAVISIGLVGLLFSVIGQLGQALYNFCVSVMDSLDTQVKQWERDSAVRKAAKAEQGGPVGASAVPVQDPNWRGAEL